MVRAGDLIAERYALDQEVASGGMGRIFRARDTRGGEIVAVKLLVDHRRRVLERFMFECAVLAEIRHPGVVRYIAHGAGEQGGAYLVMEWLEGKDLGEYLRGEGARELDLQGVGAGADIDAVASDLWEDTQDTITLAPLTTVPNAAHIANTRIRPSVMSEPLPVPLTLRFARRLTSAVAELHRRHFIHCDIKPANLFLPGGLLEQVKLIDLGTVKHYSGDRLADKPGRLSGTPYYMAPEQARATGEHTPATDVWAMGCVIYQCLVGMRPFVGEDLLTVLTRIVMEDPAPLHELRPDVPSAFADLVMSTLDKNPDGRPTDAGVLGERLEALERSVVRSDNRRPAPSFESLAALDSEAPDGEESGKEPDERVLTTAERRVTCLLFVDASHIADLSADDFQALVDAHGSRLQRLADGTCIISIAQTHSPAEQAARAARLALKLRALYPAVVLVLVTGRVAGRGTGNAPLGPVLDSAVRGLRETSPGVIQIDSLTASLLDTRFYLQRTDNGARLRNERPREVSRTLLGKPMRLVGREHELQALGELLRDAVQNTQARALLLTGGPGTGKTRLHQHFVHIVADQPATCIVARADSTRGNSAFALLSPALRQMAGIVDGEPEESQRGKVRTLAVRGARPEDHAMLSAYLGELARVCMPESECESLASARRDPVFMGQLMARAWVTWLGNQCAEQPVIIAIDDLQWADVPSMQYLKTGLSELRDRPLVVVGFARPEVRTEVAGLWSQVAVKELAIEPLSADAGRALCRQALGRRPSAQAIEDAVELAGGNALYLEELIRTLARRQPRQTSENLLGMMQERLDGLGPEAKRVLRAASIFGKSFWQGGIEALLGRSGVFNISEWLDDLVLSEAIQRRSVSRMPGDIEYEFRSGLTCEGAYAMLVEEDRKLGHRLAGAWLERSGEVNPLVLARHFSRGEARARAAPYFFQAAVQAVAGNDLLAALEYARLAEEAGASGTLQGQVRELQASVHYWQSDYRASEECGRDALTLLEVGSASWFDALGHAMVSCYRQGAQERGDELFELATGASRVGGSYEAQVSTLCRGAMQFILDGRGSLAQPAIERISTMMDEFDASASRAAGQYHNTLGLQAVYRGDWQGVLEHFQAAVDAFAAIGDTANAVAEESGVAYAFAELGSYQRASEICRRLLAEAKRVGRMSSRDLHRVNLGYFLLHVPGAQDEAQALLSASVAGYRAAGNPRMHGFALAHLAVLEQTRGNLQVAEATAQQAVAVLNGTSGYLPWALAVHADILLQCQRPEQALARAREAVAALERMGAATHGENLPALMLARALHATDRLEQAHVAIRAARARVLMRAEMISDPDLQCSFLAKSDSQQILGLASSWLDT